MITQTGLKTANVYALTDEFGDIRYVGSTGMDVKERAAVHHRHRNSEATRGNPRLNAWLRGMERPPRAILLQTVAWADRLKAEASWTRYARVLAGGELLNILDGATPPADELARRREQKLGHYRPHTPEARARISAGRKRAWEFKRQCDEWQRLAEEEMGVTLYPIPRTIAQYQSQIMQALSVAVAA